MCGMHAGEWRFLAIWIPLSVFIATADWLCQWLHPAAGVLLAVPAGFVLLNVLSYAMGGKNPAAQWRMWLAAGVLWAWFHRDAGGLTGGMAWGWMALFFLNTAALLLEILGRPLRWSGRSGILWRWGLWGGLHLMAVGAGVWWGWQWALGGGALVAAFTCLAILRPCCQWLGPVTCRTGDRSILLTIDDGPDPHDTTILLDLLDQHQVKAVFFMVGDRVLAHPELAREVVRRGHEIGNHTMTHPQATFWCAGPARTRREISECQRVIERVVGVKPRWFRAPVGHRNGFTHPIAGELGLEVMAWSRRGYDAVETDADKVLARILRRLGPGDIVLLHEGTPIAARVLAGVLARLR